MSLQHHGGDAKIKFSPSPYQSPDDVLEDVDLSVSEKREILAAWSSDRYAVASKPWLRRVPGVKRTWALTQILEALRKLDDNDPPPRGGARARALDYRVTKAGPGLTGPAQAQRNSLDVRSALVKTHQNNIDRYCRLLATQLSELERQYIHTRIAEERGELERLLEHNYI